MLQANWADAEQTRRRVITADGLDAAVSIYFGVSAADSGDHPALGALFPVAYRVEQDPHTQNHPHFHQASQFQVFLTGAGTFGKDAVQPVMAQYAQAFTPYGPIVAGERGLSYLTLRNSWDPGGMFMPAERELLKSAGRRPRAVLSSLMEADAPTALAHRATPATTVTLTPAEDGLGGWRYRLGPHQRIDGPPPADGGGQYWIVLAGRDESAAVGLDAWGCTFVSPDDPARTVTAGRGGLDVLVVQFPRVPKS